MACGWLCPPSASPIRFGPPSISDMIHAGSMQHATQKKVIFICISCQGCDCSVLRPGCYCTAPSFLRRAPRPWCAPPMVCIQSPPSPVAYRLRCRPLMRLYRPVMLATRSSGFGLYSFSAFLAARAIETPPILTMGHHHMQRPSFTFDYEYGTRRPANATRAPLCNGCLSSRAFRRLLHCLQRRIGKASGSTFALQPLLHHGRTSAQPVLALQAALQTKRGYRAFSHRF